MDRGAWWATVHGVTKSRMQLKYKVISLSSLLQHLLLLPYDTLLEHI